MKVQFDQEAAWELERTQPETCSKLTIEKLELGVKYVQSQQ